MSNNLFTGTLPLLDTILRLRSELRHAFIWLGSTGCTPTCPLHITCYDVGFQSSFQVELLSLDLMTDSDDT